jgi:phage/plasmid-like protein (TIGR03299 family)
MTTVTDRNAAFAAERSAQADAATRQQGRLEDRVRSGELQRLPGGRYKVLTGWDKGEILNSQGAPQHGLDMTKGRAALYSAVPAWHGLGNVIPGGTDSIDDVLKLGGIDFDVVKRPATFPWEGENRQVADRFVTVRDDTGTGLGTVSNRYQIIQNRDMFTFLESLVAESGTIWESAGALRGGERVFVSMRLPESIIIDRGGLDDEIQLFLAVMNNHAGRGNAECVISPWRPVCQNTERFALRDAKARWGVRHSSGALAKIHEAREALGMTVTYATEFEAEETALARTDIVIDEFHAIVADLWPLKTDSKQAKTMHGKRIATLDAMFRSETERAGLTAYAAERTITDYLDHVAPRRASKTMSEEIARATLLMEGADDEVKTTAHRKLMLLTR